MNTHDNIKELFSKGLESHSTPVRPELWNGLQAKMAAAGMGAGSAAAVKGISALTKWIIGGAAASAVAVTTVILVNQQDTPAEKEKITVQPTVAINQPAETTQSVTQEQTAAVQQAPSSTNEGTGERVEMVDYISQSEPEVREPAGYVKEEPKVPAGIVEKTPAKQERPAERTIAPAKEQKKENTAVTPEKKIEKKTSRSAVQRIPNIFTPNNDGDNDIFFVESKFLSDFSVSILNQKGEVMFKSADTDFKWDGTTLSGEEAPSGSYVCVIVAKGENDEFIKEYKVVELRR